MTDPREPVDIDEAFRRGDVIDRALRLARRDAYEFNKKMGVPIVVWEDGKVVWIEPEDIVVPDVEDPDVEDPPA